MSKLIEGWGALVVVLAYLGWWGRGMWRKRQMGSLPALRPDGGLRPPQEITIRVIGEKKGEGEGPALLPEGERVPPREEMH